MDPRPAANRVERQPVQVTNRVDLAVFAGDEGRREAARSLGRDRARDRRFEHAEPISVEVGQAGAQVLGLIGRAGQSQAAAWPVIAGDVEPAGQRPHALVRAPAEVQHGAGAIAPP